MASNLKLIITKYSEMYFTHMASSSYVQKREDFEGIFSVQLLLRDTWVTPRDIGASPVNKSQHSVITSQD